jgi:hypothetical protein
LSTELLLTIVTIGLPFIMALILGRWGSDKLKRWAAAVTLGLAGLSALALLIISGRLSVLTVVLLSLILVLISLLREANDRNDFSFFLLLCSAWAVIVLPISFVTMLFGLSMLLIVVGRWTRARGSSVVPGRSSSCFCSFWWFC